MCMQWGCDMHSILCSWGGFLFHSVCLFAGSFWVMARRDGPYGIARRWWFTKGV